MTDAWLQRALSAHKRGDYTAALQASEQAPSDAHSQRQVHSLCASALAKLGRRDEALGHVRSACELGARSAELYLLAARICVDREDLESALEWTDRAAKDSLGVPRILKLREEIVLRMHLQSGLFEHMELVVELQPQDTEARAQLIEACVKLRLFDLAQQHIEIALSQRPVDVRLNLDKATACIGMGRVQAAIETLDQVLSRGAGMNHRVQVAWLLIKAGAVARAAQVARDNLALAPGQLEVRLQCGFFSLWQGDVTAATSLCRGLPESATGVARLKAAIAFVEGRYESTVALAEQALGQDRRDAEAQALRAAGLFYLKRYAEAEHSARTASQSSTEWLPAAQVIEIAARASPYKTVTRFEVAEIFSLLEPLWGSPVVLSSERRDVETTVVLAKFDSGLRRLSGNFSSALTFVADGAGTWSSFTLKPPARVACLRVFDSFQARPWPSVAARLRALAVEYPRSPYVHTHAAELWLWFGDYAACEAECRSAIAISKTQGSRWAWVGLGAALMLQGRHAEALEVFAESNQILPIGPPLLAYRGETLRRCGDFDAAREDFTQSLARVPTRVSAWLNLGLLAGAQRKEGEVRDIYDRLSRQLPRLVDDVERDMPLPTAAAGDPEAMVATFEHALRVMRGNRASNRITYFLKDGRARLQMARVLE